MYELLHTCSMNVQHSQIWLHLALKSYGSFSAQAMHQKFVNQLQTDIYTPRTLHSAFFEFASAKQLQPDDLHNNQSDIWETENNAKKLSQSTNGTH